MSKLLDFKKFLSTMPFFFTNWCITLFILTNIFSKQLPFPILLCSQNLILTTSILGYYLIKIYGYKIINKYKSFKPIHIDIFNYVKHIFPLIFIFFIRKEILIYRNSNDIMYSVLFSYLFIQTYLKLCNPEEIYWFTGYKKNSLILLALVIYVLCFIVPKLLKI